MTNEELRGKMESLLLNPYRFVPVALDLNTGDRVYIDMPEQVELGTNSLTIARRGQATKENYAFDSIEGISPVDRLPAEPGGISYKEFDASIHRLLMADPFRPFTIELRNGRRIELARRGATVRAGRGVVFIGEPPQFLVKITYDQIARISANADAIPA